VSDLLVRWAILAAAIALTAWLLPGMDVEGAGTTFVIAAVFATLNVVLGSLLRLLAFPLMALSLGLFAFVLNATLFLVTSEMLDSFEIDDFWTALVAALLVSVLCAVIEGVLELRHRQVREAA
jgi:putative membrane protein